MLDNMKAININFENGDNIIIDARNIKDFYISNLDANGNEIPYEPTIINNKLYANFVLINLKQNLNNNFEIFSSPKNLLLSSLTKNTS